MADLEVRLLRPTSKRDHSQRWEVLVGGEVVGWLEAHRIGQARSVFYRATAPAPDGQVVSLENDVEFDAQIARIVKFHENPEKFRGWHWHPRSSYKGRSQPDDAP